VQLLVALLEWFWRRWSTLVLGARGAFDVDLHDLTVWLILAAVVGGLTYNSAAAYYGKPIEFDRLILTALAALMVPSGVDLVYGALVPQHLVEVAGTYSGSPVVVIGQMHRIDIAIAGLVLCVLGIVEVSLEVRKIKNGTHHP
jgi:hypothetical protein